MKENAGNVKVGKTKSLFRKLVEKIDKKMEEKAKNGKCCNSGKTGDKSCCG